MAACDLSTLITNSACRTHDVITIPQQKMILIYALWQAAQLTSSGVSLTMAAVIRDSVCFRNVSEDDYRAFLIQSVQNGYAALSGGAWNITDAQALSTMSCFQLGAHEFDAVISYLLCQLLSNLPAA